MEQKPIRLGLCCINNKLRKQKPPVYSSRTARLATIQRSGIEYLRELSIQNIKDTELILEENLKLGISVFRISSEVFPHITNMKCGGYSLDFAKEHLKNLGNLAKKYKQRITAHPGQFNVLSSPHEKVIENTIRDLNFQAEMFDLMGMDEDSVMVIHGGGFYGDKPSAIERWVDNFQLLSESAQKRLVLENCEKCFNVEECIIISHKIKEKYGFLLPIVVDSHHVTCFNILHPDEALSEEKIESLIPCVMETWIERDIRMKVHISEQGDGRIGHHSDYVEVIPKYFLDIYDVYGMEFDIMIEAKAKEKAIKKLYENYQRLTI